MISRRTDEQRLAALDRQRADLASAIRERDGAARRRRDTREKILPGGAFRALARKDAEVVFAGLRELVKCASDRDREALAPLVREVRARAYEARARKAAAAPDQERG